MTNIFEYQKTKLQGLKKKDKTPAETLFLNNIWHIEKIRTTDGYKMIRRFWVTEWNMALQNLSKVDINDLPNIYKEKAKLELATTFVTYLDAHEKGLT